MSIRFLIIFVLLLGNLYAKSAYSLVDSSLIKKPKIAVCYWGLTRSTKKVYESHYINLFHVLENNNIPYDVYMHTWHLNGKQRVDWHEIDIPIDYDEYRLLNPKYYQIDSQDEFISSLDFNQYYKDFYHENEDRSNDEWNQPLLLLNHLCALESLKRVTDRVLNSGQDYDLIMYVRPDVWLRNAFPVDCLYDLKDYEIIIPNFAHYSGYNDRFAVLTYQTAPLYGKRIDFAAEYRANKGRIISERYLKYTCESNNLKIRFINFYFDLIRP